MANDQWTPIPLQPLTGGLDTRSRPSELSPGAFRYKLNWGVNRVGHLTRAPGYAILDLGTRTDDPDAVENWDYHFRGHDREPVTLGFESIAPDGERRLFVGTQSTVAYLDNDNSQWIEIASGMGADGSRFKMAALTDKVFFTNDVDEPRMHTLGELGSSTIPELQATTIKAKVVIQFAGVIVWMNTVEVGDAAGEHPERIRWSDYREGESYDASDPESVASFQDLDYGDEILAAIELINAVYIFTTSAIWRMTVQTGGNADTIFGFTRIYSEAKNKAGCLAYENSPVSDGKNLYWLARDSIWTYNPYTAAPEAADWLLKASGHLYSETHPDRLEKRCCVAAIGQYHPDTKEVWFSYQLGSAAGAPTCINNRSLVLNVEFKTADIRDVGFTMLLNFTPGALTAQDCRATSIFIGASGIDYCLKDIGTVFHRENVTLIDDDPENDIPDDSYAFTTSGYYSRKVGQVPLGYPQRDKVIGGDDGIIIQHETAEDDNEVPNLITLRIGNSEHAVDPMSLDAKCSPQWHEQDSVDLVCPDDIAQATLAAQGMKPSESTVFFVNEEAKFLYFDFRITSSTGGAPIGSDSAWSSITFNSKVI